MKRIIIPITLVLILAASCSDIDAINEVNANMNLPFPIALAEDALEYGAEYEREQGFGGYTLSKDGLMFWVSGWPDVVDEYHITEYRFTSKEYNVFGIAVGTTLDNAVSILKKHGYRRDKEEETWYGESNIYKKNGQVRILLRAGEDGSIHEIWVTAIATNKDKVVF